MCLWIVVCAFVYRCVSVFVDGCVSVFVDGCVSVFVDGYVSVFVDRCVSACGIIAIDLTDHCPIFLNLRNINSNKVATKIRLVFRVHHPTNVEKYKEKIREILSSVDFDRH